MAGEAMVDALVAEYSVAVDGSPIAPEVARDLLDVSITDTLEMSSTFTLHLDSWDMDRQAVSWADAAPFGLGAEVEIQMGYRGALTPLILGVVVSLHLSFSAGKGPVLTVTGNAVGHRLTQAPAVKTFKNQTDSDIATAIIQGNNLTPQVDKTDTVREHELQANKTDWAFLAELAKRNNFEIAMAGKTVRFGKRDTSQAPIVLSPNRNVLSFEASVSAGEVFSEVTVQGKDANTKDAFNVKETCTQFPGQLKEVDNLAPKPYTLTRTVAGSDADAQSLAKSKVSDTQRNMLTASGSCLGDPRLRAGMVVDVADVGKRFSGSYRVTSATHSFSSGTYTTSFQLSWSGT